MSAWCLGIDTSNYTTSVAGCDTSGAVRSRRQPFDVAPGKRGVRQSDAVFLHTKALPGLIEQLMEDYGCPPAAVCVSETPRDAEGSYMPCFLTGVLAARGIAAALQVPLFAFPIKGGISWPPFWAVPDKGTCPFSCRSSPTLPIMFLEGQPSCSMRPSGRRGMAPSPAWGRGPTCMRGSSSTGAACAWGSNSPVGRRWKSWRSREARHCRPCAFPRRRSFTFRGWENKFEALLRQSRPADAALWLLESLAAGLVALARAGMQGKEELTLVLAGGVCSNRLICERLARHFDVRSTSHEFAADNACGTALYGALALRGEEFQA